jgi:transposase
MIKGYKIRIYPNKEQKILIEKHIGNYIHLNMISTYDIILV